MRTINEIANEMSVQRPSQINRAGYHKQAPQTGISTQAAEIVNRLFAELQAIFPAWRYAFPDDESVNQAKKNWAKGFIENGICTMPQVQAGLRRARLSESPHIPSVGQFVAWCSPELEDYGLPDERTAYLEACRKSHDLHSGSWSHPAIYVAGRETGFFELKTRPENKTFPLFKRNYEIVCRRVIAGEDFQSEIPKALPKAPTSKPTSREKALRHIEKIKASLGMRRKTA